MRRRPNPWIAAPAMVAGLFGGGLGLVGTAVVMVLVSRSIAEWREYQERGPEDPRS